MALRTLTALLLLALALPAQDLAFSVSVDQAMANGDTLLEEEVAFVGPNLGPDLLLPVEAWSALFGDSDQDGIFDDGPGDLDALHLRGGGLDGLLFSTTATITARGIGTVRDGDVVRVLPDGSFALVHDEAWFEAVTQTSAVDVDAYCEGPLGEVWFSFAEDETTSDPLLIAQNGGSATLDEQCVFRIDPGAATAVLELSRSDVVALFNQALGTSVTSVVDVTGITLDPGGSGLDLLLCCGSTSTALRARVVSTRNGGQLFQLGGVPLDEAKLGVPAAQLDALAVLPLPAWPSLQLLPREGSAQANDSGVIRMQGLAPGEGVQLIMTEPPAAAPWATGYGGLPGAGLAYVDPAHPMWWQSWFTPAWTMTADAFGSCSFRFHFGGLPVGTNALLQGITLPTGALTNPVLGRVLP